MTEALRDACRERPFRHRTRTGRPGMDQVREHLAQAVEGGRLTQERADQILGCMEARRSVLEGGDRRPPQGRLRERLHQQT